jgi:hypothetical protein
MENLSTLEIVGIIVLVLIFGGFIWRIAKRMVTLLLIAVLVVVGIYFVKPTILYDWFGKENVNKVETVVTDKTQELQEKTKETTTELLDKAEKNK